METWVSGQRAEFFIRNLGFQFHIPKDAEGFSKGIWICWSDPNIQVVSVLQHKQIVHCQVHMDDFFGYLSAIYGSPNAASRKELWDIIKNIGNSMHDKWLLMRDFNTFLHPDNK